MELSGGNTNGVIISQAGRFGGWTFYMKGGKLFHEYNFFGLEHYRIGSAKPISAGNHIFRFEYINDAPQPGSGGNTILYVDGQKVAEGRIPKTQPFVYSADEGVDVGMDNETAVSNDYKEGDNKFTGKIRKITINTKPSNLGKAEEKEAQEKEEAAKRAQD